MRLLQRLLLPRLRFLVLLDLLDLQYLRRPRLGLLHSSSESMSSSTSSSSSSFTSTESCTSFDSSRGLSVGLRVGDSVGLRDMVGDTVLGTSSECHRSDRFVTRRCQAKIKKKVHHFDLCVFRYHFDRNFSKSAFPKSRLFRRNTG